ncbi:MAG: S-layer homology domain-containing protein, partial [Candidatus Gracilibacteria bacterium]|nr:S-layer homology domain-containing protein [Candidatus Gracilibacteria bacterium]
MESSLVCGIRHIWGDRQFFHYFYNFIYIPMSNTFLKKVTSALSVATLVFTAVGSSLTANAGSEFKKYADAMVTAGYINAQADEAGYRLGDNITRAEMAKIAVKVAGVTVGECTGKVFSDVSATQADLCKYIEAAATAGLVNKSLSKFRPSDLLTRAEMVKMLLGALKIPAVSESQGFKDIAGLGDLAGFINAAAKANIVNKGDNFYPSKNATRGEAFKVAANAA